MTDYQTVRWEEFGGDVAALPPGRWAELGDETLDLRIELGRAYKSRDEVDEYRVGMVLPLDNDVREPVALYANGRLVAWGEAVEVEGRYGVRVTQLAAPPAEPNPQEAE